VSALPGEDENRANCNVAGMEVSEVAIIGLGTMGAGIAEVCARAGLRVTAIEVDPPALTRGMGILDGSLAKAVARGKLTGPEQAEIFGRIRPAASIADAAAADLVIEAVPERMEIKRQIFADLDRVCGLDAVLATNTSSLSVTAIAAATQHPARVVGMHFFNPAPVMRLVEVVTTVLTDRDVGQAATELARRFGKTPVQVTDRAGFVANALLLPYLNHAVALLETGYATREDIDAAATGGIGLPMGPLALLDLIGLDTSLSILQVLHGEFGGSRYAPAPLLRRLADASRTGRKSGSGFFDYAKKGPVDPASPGIIQNAQHSAAPATVTLIDAGGDSAGELAGTIAAAGISLTRNPAHASDLVIVAAAPDRDVLAVAQENGLPDAVGVHLPGDKVAELVTTPLTSASAAAAAAALACKLGLRVVRSPNRPGFLVGALLYPHLNDAAAMVQDGYASASAVDTAMTLGCGYPRGPMQILDDIGPGVALSVLRAMHQVYGNPAFAPVPLLAEYAAAGLNFCS
jgi:3-hydroxybutyryl-CoA dehydrogenase